MAGPTPTPGETEVVLGKHQVKFAGGPILGEGTDYDLRSIEGLDMPAARIVALDRDGEHGSYMYARFTEHRTIVLEVLVIIPPGESHQRFLRELGREFIVRTAPEPLFFRLDDDMRIIFCLPVDFDYVIEPATYNPGSMRVQMILACPEPRVFTLQKSQTTRPQAIVGGRVYPKIYPFTYNTQGRFGRAVVLNEGSVLSWPRFTITGPALNPKITHEETGRHFQLNVDMAPSDVAVIDNDLKVVALNGEPALKLKTDISEFIFLEPGDNTLRYSAGSGELEVAWRSADMIG